MKVRKELNATSSQDEFAKWAKLRRQHDKLLEQVEKNSTSSSQYLSLLLGVVYSKLTDHATQKPPWILRKRLLTARSVLYDG